MSMPNVFCILGNHEYAFLKFYHALSEECDGNFEPLLERLSEYFPGEESFLDWEMIDYLDSLPAYLERDDFICVHSGLPLDLNGFPLPLKLASIDSLVHDRRFKDPTLLHRGNKCVFFGHTHTSYICGESKILAYRRRDKAPRGDISDYYKIHLDTGCFSSGVLGCFCVETLNAYYVKK
jgi:diadenosine tetraphosphatase ApaH/serine/threonine PP2A family protein phosphatase